MPTKRETRLRRLDDLERQAVPVAFRVTHVVIEEPGHSGEIHDLILLGTIKQREEMARNQRLIDGLLRCIHRKQSEGEDIHTPRDALIRLVGDDRASALLAMPAPQPATEQPEHVT